MAKDYKLHLGEYVRKTIEDSYTTNKAEVSRRLQIGKNSLSERFKKPHYGTVFDLLETSEILGINLFNPVLAVLQKGDLPLEKLYSEDQVKEYRKKISEQSAIIANLEEEKRRLYTLLENALKEK